MTTTGPKVVLKNKGMYDDKSTKDKPFKPSQNSRMQTGGGSQVNSGNNGNPRYQQRCYLCNQLGHIAKYCKQSKSKETESSGGSSQVTMTPNEKAQLFAVQRIHIHFCIQILIAVWILFGPTTRAVSLSMLMSRYRVCPPQV